MAHKLLNNFKTNIGASSTSFDSDYEFFLAAADKKFAKAAGQKVEDFKTLYEKDENLQMGVLAAAIYFYSDAPDFIKNKYKDIAKGTLASIYVDVKLGKYKTNEN